jgi:hypothetical protein
MVRRLSVLSLVLAAVVATAATAEDAAPRDPREQERPELDKAAAQERVKAATAVLGGKADAAARIAALEELAAGRHEEVSKLLKKALKERNRDVALAATRLLGTQRDETARKALLELAQPGRRFEPERAAEAIRSLGYTGYGNAFEQLEKVFFEHRERDVRKALAETFGRQREKKAVSLLIAVLDAPMPKNPNDPANPPADWWGDRHVEWSHFKDAVATALEAITGTRLVTSDEALAWVKENGKANGIAYKAPANPWGV